MSTRSFIGKVYETGETNNILRGVYCHFDGYIEGVGAILHEHYQSPEKIDELIALGDLSYLGKEIWNPNENEPSIEFDSYIHTRSYH